MTLHHDDSDRPTAPPELPELHPDDTSEDRARAWAELLRRDGEIPESVYDEALARLLEEIRLSL